MWQGLRGRQGLLLSLAPSVRDSSADGCPARGDEGLQVGRPGPRSGEQGAGLLETNPIVNATASGQGREPLGDVGEVVQEVAPSKSKILQGGGKLWGIQAEDAEILAKVEGLLQLEVSGRGSHGVKGER